MDGETAEQRERRLIREAEARAREDARVESHLSRHDEQLRVLHEAIVRDTVERATLKEQLGTLSTDFRQNMAITAARAEDAKRAAENARDAAAKQVTRIDLYIAAAAVVATIIGALLAAGIFQ